MNKPSDELQKQKIKNRNLGLTLGLIAIVFFVGFLARMVVFGK
ncbi:MAG TPA: cytochrome oxidase small assembly protein [Burkholderiaceae bacterium]|nr:cytochrome oxidase small assembly protein [Burkholderiaceae bacterium]